MQHLHIDLSCLPSRLDKNEEMKQYFHYKPFWLPENIPFPAK